MLSAVCPVSQGSRAAIVCCTDAKSTLDPSSVAEPTVSLPRQAMHKCPSADSRTVSKNRSGNYPVDRYFTVPPRARAPGTLATPEAADRRIRNVFVTIILGNYLVDYRHTNRDKTWAALGIILSFGFRAGRRAARCSAASRRARGGRVAQFGTAAVAAPPTARAVAVLRRRGTRHAGRRRCHSVWNQGMRIGYKSRYKCPPCPFG